MLVGGYSEEKVGRNMDEKVVVVIGVEKSDDGRIGSCNLKI
jgi:hypothetical protein